MESDSKEARNAEPESKYGKRGSKSLPTNLKPKFSSRRYNKSEEKIEKVVPPVEGDDEKPRELNEAEKKEIEEEVIVDGTVEAKDHTAASPVEPNASTPLRTSKTLENFDKTYERVEKTYEKAERTCEKPERTCEKPEKAGEKLEKPERTFEKPEKAGEKPEKTGERPEKTGEKPEKTGEKPEKTGERGHDKLKDVGERAPKNLTDRRKEVRKKCSEEDAKKAPVKKEKLKIVPTQNISPTGQTGGESVYVFPNHKYQQPLLPGGMVEQKTAEPLTPSGFKGKSRKPSTFLRKSRSAEALSGRFKKFFRKTFWLSSKAAEATANPTPEMIAKPCVIPEYGQSTVDWQPDPAKLAIPTLTAQDRLLLSKNKQGINGIFMHHRPFWLDKESGEKILPEKSKIQVHKAIKAAINTNPNAVLPKVKRREGTIDPLIDAVSLGKVNEEQKWRFDSKRIVANTYYGTLMFEMERLGKANKPKADGSDEQGTPGKKMRYKYIDENGKTCKIKDPPTHVKTLLHMYDRKDRPAIKKSHGSRAFQTLRYVADGKKPVKKTKSSTNLQSSSNTDSKK